jgi:hypothetical protein|tara:strand:- start:259 stop:444 length:186 start_codon:yes stop_codon:yes gene_type:complete
MENNSNEKDKKIKLADINGQHHAMPFDRKNDSSKILLKRFKQNHAFEETKAKKNSENEDQE